MGSGRDPAWEVKGQAAQSQAHNARQRKRDRPGAGMRVTPHGRALFSPRGGAPLFAARSAPGAQNYSHTLSPPGWPQTVGRGGEQATAEGKVKVEAPEVGQQIVGTSGHPPPPHTARPTQGRLPPTQSPAVPALLRITAVRVLNDLDRSDPCWADLRLPDPHSPALPRPQRRGKGRGRGRGPDGGGAVTAGAGIGRYWGGAQRGTTPAQPPRTHPHT